MQAPIIDPAEMEKERKVVLEELASVADSPGQQVDLLVDELMWPEQPLGWDVGGTEESVGALTRDTLLFIAGFGSVFVLLGLSTSALGSAVVHQQILLTRMAGVLVVAMALFLVGTLVLRTPGLYREWRPHPMLQRFGPFAAPVAGAAFAFGWTPCVGPILASVLALSAEQGHVASGALLLSVYSLGLGVPFLVVAIFFERVRGPLAWLRRHGPAVTVASASVLGVLGVLLVLDRLAWITTLVQNAT